MFVPTIYIENSNENMSVEVSDKKLHHLNQVLRLRDGDKVNISDGKGLISYGNFINNFFWLPFENIKFTIKSK